VLLLLFKKKRSCPYGAGVSGFAARLVQSKKRPALVRRQAWFIFSQHVYPPDHHHPQPHLQDICAFLCLQFKPNQAPAPIPFARI
jgi:hypothetical protein